MSPSSQSCSCAKVSVFVLVRLGVSKMSPDNSDSDNFVPSFLQWFSILLYSGFNITQDNSGISIRRNSAHPIVDDTMYTAGYAKINTLAATTKISSAEACEVESQMFIAQLCFFTFIDIINKTTDKSEFF